MDNDQEIEQIREIVTAMSRRYEGKDGAIAFAGIDAAGVVKVAPSGFCWR